MCTNGGERGEGRTPACLRFGVVTAAKLAGHEAPDMGANRNAAEQDLTEIFQI